MNAVALRLGILQKEPLPIYLHRHHHIRRKIKTFLHFLSFILHPSFKWTLHFLSVIIVYSSWFFCFIFPTWNHRPIFSLTKLFSFCCFPTLKNSSSRFTTCEKSGIHWNGWQWVQLDSQTIDARGTFHKMYAWELGIPTRVLGWMCAVEEIFTAFAIPKQVEIEQVDNVESC